MILACVKGIGKSLRSPVNSSESADVLYEEDPSSSDPIAMSSTNSSKSPNVILIEDFLTHFLRYSSPHCESNKKSHFPLNLDSLGHTAIVLDFEIDRAEPCFEDLQAILSDILSLKVRYKVVATNVEEEKVSFFIVKIPATNSEDRQLASLAGADHREIFFYTNTVPDIKQCLERGRIDLPLSFAQCYHAQYDRPLEEKAISGVLENLSKAESIIVLEDLRPQGFGKRHYSQALSLKEIKTALREIAKIHAATWSIQEVSGQSLSKSWSFHYRAEFAAMLYEALLEDGLPRLEKFLKELVESNRDVKAAKILERLAAFRNRGIRNSLYKLLIPSPEPSPTCLVHMDFWCDNIFFRKQDSDSSDAGLNDFENVEKESILEDLRKDDTESLECRILDWQMFSVGRPTHDIALLLFTSLESSVRKDCTEGLLEFYFRIFRQTAMKFDTPLTFDLAHLCEQYNQSQVLAVLQVIASIDLVLNNEMTQERLMDALMELIDKKLF
ncbi:unnamed protein product [Allacma fusca]|uniref:CHK kinase-like domain-containing protein n=1 Tax=Allacma fusca TaxID=39272 RepID=A0A8J2KRT5_9HEXA|nr:unnamed protein product [Allacma fusca]